jgi:two-component system, OmpR family, phosphate regulon sensor histidine kinase PhoR
MSLEEPGRAEAESAASRLWKARRTLAVAFVCLALLAVLEPRLSLLALLGAVLTAAVTAFLPDAASAPPQASGYQSRRQVWPDASTKAMAEALTFPAYVIDASAVLRYANAAAEPAFGAPVIGEPASITFRRPEIAELIARAVASGTMQSREITDPVPRERWFQVQIGPVPRAGSTPAFFLLTFMDMTEARRAEQMRSDFIANASHELRTPLASLRGFLETIKGPAAGDKAATARFLDIMLDQAERMSRLIDDLLSLSRIEMKAHMRPQGSVDLADVLGNVVNSLHPLARKLGVVIEQKLPPGPLEIVGERDELIQVFDNLVENACKYGQSGGKVAVEGKLLEPIRPGGAQRVEIAVIDHGPGISSEHLPRLTERFYRADVDSSREKQGTGLGLAIVKHILNRHGTRLAITSSPGNGARFAVTFALKTAEAAVEKSD